MTESEPPREQVTQQLERWLHAEGVARYDAYHRGQGAGRPVSEVFARLRARAGRKAGAATRGKTKRR